MKNFGFTLSEVLIAVVIIGVVSILTVPSLLQNSRNSSDMVMLKSVVSNIDDVMRPELVKTGGQTLVGTLLVDNPNGFLEKFNYNENASEPFASSYRKYNGGSPVNTQSYKISHSVFLNNGAGIGICPHKVTVRGVEYEQPYIFIDINGPKKPNTIGVDMFVVKVSGYNDYTKSIHVGDVRPIGTGELGASVENCKKGNIAYCYNAAELSGFDPNYLEE